MGSCSWRQEGGQWKGQSVAPEKSSRDGWVPLRLPLTLKPGSLVGADSGKGRALRIGQAESVRDAEGPWHEGTEGAYPPFQIL